MRKAILIFMISFAFVIPAGVSAYEIRKGDTVIVPKDEVIDGNLYAAGANINMSRPSDNVIGRAKLKCHS